MLRWLIPLSKYPSKINHNANILLHFFYVESNNLILVLIMNRRLMQAIKSIYCLKTCNNRVLHTFCNLMYGLLLIIITGTYSRFKGFS